ncbi:hypothetical protein GGTG_12762 [Gaeumannomyces tritici R3-111a-1]|uniref:Uncharacterized protein n=1 Tax=Gaeumannomyces tritici (strain R3-111a-1) TaxID=644352 RepID=J3PGY2_GAET3|nr:hypothetical protein GGTG_12762 [Gaeumannomyces tritici R3-111a-1]EJT69879.1 hypothetical protein GGTG_12762 [Gaeumannomyces tritici R3-111a-1]
MASAVAFPGSELAAVEAAWLVAKVTGSVEFGIVKKHVSFVSRHISIPASTPSQDTSGYPTPTRRALDDAIWPPK